MIDQLPFAPRLQARRFQAEHVADGGLDVGDEVAALVGSGVTIAAGDAARASLLAQLQDLNTQTAATMAERDKLSALLKEVELAAAAAVKIIDSGTATGVPIEQVTVTARVQTDPAALRTTYGALMLNYSVLDAARKACTAPIPLVDDDGTCVHDAVESAKPQVDAAIARARSGLTD